MFIFTLDTRKVTAGMVIFFCRHAFHTDCLNTVVCLFLYHAFNKSFIFCFFTNLLSILGDVSYLLCHEIKAWHWNIRKIAKSMIMIQI